MLRMRQQVRWRCPPRMTAFPRARARLCAVLVLLACFAQPAATADVRARTVRVGLYANPPKVLSSQGGGPGGIFVDVLQRVAEQEGYVLVFEDGTFGGELERVLNRDVDLMVDVALIPERLEQFDFSIPVLQSWNVVYARRASNIKRIADLADKRVAVLASSVQERNLHQAVARFGYRTQVITFDTYDMAFKAVREGLADAVVSNPFYGGAGHGGLQDTSIVFGDATFHFVAKKGENRDVMQAIDRHLARMKADPESVYFRSFQRLQATQRGEILPRWVKPASAVLLAFVLLVWFWGYSHQRLARRLRISQNEHRRVATELGRIFDNSLDVIAVLDEQLRILRVSPACRMWGYEPGGIVGSSSLVFLPPQDRERAKVRLARVRRGFPARSRSAVCLDKDGRPVPVTWSAVWVPDEREIHAVVRDDTHRTRLLAALRRQNDQFEAANADLRVLGFSLSHDLRSPIAAVGGFNERALELLEPTPLPDVQRLLQRSVAAVGRMDRMVSDLAALMRVAGQPIAPVPIGLSELAADVARHAHDPSGKAIVTIAPDMRVNADWRLMTIALENLLNNALKFSARKEQPEVELGVLEDAGETVFFVRDNGAGFDPAYGARLFRPFSRLHGQAEFPGTGIGLSIVDKVIRRHGGRIWATSTVGGGATFFFTLADKKPIDLGSPERRGHRVAQRARDRSPDAEAARD